VAQFRTFLHFFFCLHFCEFCSSKYYWLHCHLSWDSLWYKLSPSSGRRVLSYDIHVARWRPHVPLKQFLSTRLHGVTSQKITVLKDTNFSWKKCKISLHLMIQKCVWAANEVIEIRDIIHSTSCFFPLLWFLFETVWWTKFLMLISSSLDFHFEFAVSFLISSVPTWTCLFQVIERSYPTYLKIMCYGQMIIVL